MFQIPYYISVFRSKVSLYGIKNVYLHQNLTTNEENIIYTNTTAGSFCY